MRKKELSENVRNKNNKINKNRSINKKLLFFSFIILFSILFLIILEEVYAQENGFMEILGINTKIRASHPRLFITSENLQLLRQRVQTTHSTEYKQIVEWCNSNFAVTEESGGDRARAFAFLFLLNKDGMVMA